MSGPGNGRVVATAAVLIHSRRELAPFELQVPQVRNGYFSTELIARYQRSVQMLLLSLMEMVTNAVTTRKVKRISEELCGTSFLKLTVSDLCQRLDPLVQAWNERESPDLVYPFLIVFMH